MSDDVRNNEAASQFEIEIDGHKAVAAYRREAGRLVLTHTEVPEALGGRGIGGKLAAAALGYVREQGLKVVPQCPFMSAYIGKHPEYQDLVA